MGEPPRHVPAGFATGNGRLIEIAPHEGDAVRTGNVVARIDVADLQAQCRQVQAQRLAAIQAKG